MPQTFLDWSKIFSAKYWFQGTSPESLLDPVVKDSAYFWIFLGFFSFVVTAGVVMMVLESFLHLENPLKQRLTSWGANIVAMGYMGIFWFLMRQLKVFLLGARFWLLILLVWFLILLYLVVKYFILYFQIEYLYFKQNTLSSKNGKSTSATQNI